MAAPVNNDFSGAVAISGASGNLSGTTVEATVQSGEPGHYNYNPAASYPTARSMIGPYATVWYSWACPPRGGTFFFSTRDATGANRTNFKSTVRVFTGSAVGSLAEVPLLLDQSVGFGNGFDNGAVIAFAASFGSVYRIQVDCRFNAADTGIFILSWGEYENLQIGSCDTCQPMIGNDCLVASATLNLLSSDISSFGDIPARAGYFVVKYCKGAFNTAVGNTPSWTIGDSYVVVWQNGGDQSQSFSGLPAYSTQAEAERAFLCWQLEIEHTGGEIGVYLDDVDYTDNYIGTAPVFGLYYSPFTIDMLQAVNFGISGSGTSWTFSFGIKNLSSRTWDGCLVELLSTGGISSGGSTTVTLAANSDTGTVGINCTADPAAGLVTATIRISRHGVVVGTLDYPIYPIYAVSFTGLNTTEKTCTGFKYWRSTLVATLIWPADSVRFLGIFGALPTLLDPSTGNPYRNTLQAVFSAVSGTPQLYSYSSCTPVSSITNNFLGDYLPSFTINPGFQASAAPQSVAVQMTFGWKVSATVTYSLPTFSQTIVIPPA